LTAVDIYEASGILDKTEKAGAAMHNSPGFSEAPQPDLLQQSSFGKDGRILIPIALREAAGVKPGERVSIRIADGAIIIETIATQIRKVQAMVAPYIRPGESIVDEFIAEKRRMWGEED
jgi:bifunctional DNA-binding transcriptional regulator/antitoxin component of YhaV-PrlF toxin-antitoxin module